MDKKQRLAYIGLFMITIIIGLSFIFVKVGLRYTNAMDLLAHRFSAAAITVLLLWLLGYIKLPRFSSQKAKSLLLLSLFYPLLFFALQTYGLEHSSASEAGIIFATTPIITLIAAGVFLKEKTTLLQKTGIALSIIGIFYIIYSTGSVAGSTSPVGLLLLMLSVLAVVTYYVLGKLISAHFSAIEITVWMTILAFIVFNGFSIAGHIQDHTLSQFFNPLIHMEFLWAVLYLGILSSLVTSFFTNFALTQVSASKIAVINNLSPIVSITGGVLILGDTLFSYHLIGGLLVLIGVAMTVLSNYKNQIHK